MSETALKLSDHGKSLAEDPTLSEYLRCYEFPQPPELRYGYLRFDSPQEKDRVGLFGQAWIPLHAVGTVLLIHGFAEHGGNYARLVRDLVNAQYAVALLDFRGHGLSEGPRGHVDSFETYAQDAEAFLRQIYPQLLPGRPLYVFGHSLGGLVALQLLLRKNLPATPAAAVLTSPLLGFPELTGPQRYLAMLAPLISKLVPTLPVAHGIPSDRLSHDSEYLQRRGEDPLIGNVATPRWLTSVERAVAEVQARAEDFSSLAPTLLMLAGDEKVTNLNEARQFAFRAYGGLRHKVIEFPGYYHELEKEKNVRDRVVGETLAWLRSHP